MIVCSVVALLALACVQAAAQGPHEASEETEEIRARERALAEAMHARDRYRLDRLLGFDYVLLGSPDIDRTTWIRNAVTLCWGGRSDIDHFRTRTHGDVIVAVFELTFYVDPSTCQPTVLRSFITDIWAREGGEWRLQTRYAGPVAAGAGLASQYGAVPLPPPVWNVSSELSLVATTGNTSVRTLGLGGEVTHRGDADTTRASVAFLTSDAEGTTRARSFMTTVRHGVRVRSRLELFGRAAYSRDRFAGIENRATIDAGAAYTLELPNRHSLTLEAGVGFIAEQRLDDEDLRFAVATGTADYRLAIAPGTEFAERLQLAADLGAASNWRGTNTAAVVVTLTRRLSLKVSHALEYRNMPVGGFGRTDTKTAAALVISYERRGSAVNSATVSGGP
jgi:putative salt-induced outer membrane protein YdiY